MKAWLGIFSGISFLLISTVSYAHPEAGGQHYSSGFMHSAGGLDILTGLILAGLVAWLLVTSHHK